MKLLIIQQMWQLFVKLKKIGRYAALVILVNHRRQNLAKRLETHYLTYQCRTGMFRIDIWIKRWSIRIKPEFSGGVSLNR